jgi:hypothetical protein
MFMMAYEIYELQNSHQNIGLGMIGGEFEAQWKKFFNRCKRKNEGRRIPILLYRKTIKSSGSRWIWKLCDKKRNYGWSDAFLTA